MLRIVFVYVDRENEKKCLLCVAVVSICAAFVYICVDRQKWTNADILTEKPEILPNG